MFYLRGEELLVHSNCCCCCTASATATLCFAFTHTLPRSLAHTHLLTHAHSVFVSFNPPLSPCLSTAFSLLIPPSFHHLLSAIHPSLSSGFPLSVSASPCFSRIDFWQQRSCRKRTGLELFLSQFHPHMLISAPSHVS